MSDAMLVTVSQSIAPVFGREPEAILVADWRSDSVSGTFFDNGDIYPYVITDSGIVYQKSVFDSILADQCLRDYLEGRYGFRCDAESAYDYAKGRFGAELKLDRQVQCKSGTPCGGRCLPQGHTCHSGGGQAAVGEAKRSGSGRALGSLALKAGAVVGGAVLAGHALKAGALHAGAAVLSHSTEGDVSHKQAHGYLKAGVNLEAETQKQTKKMLKAGASHEDIANYHMQQAEKLHGLMKKHGLAKGDD